jgi:hypothetical protein
VDNPIYVPAPRKNNQGQLRIYDSKPFSTDLWTTIAFRTAALAAADLRPEACPKRDCRMVPR